MGCKQLKQPRACLQVQTYWLLLPATIGQWRFVNNREKRILD